MSCDTHSMRHFDQAAVFAEACLEYGLLQHKENCELHVYTPSGYIH